MGEQEDVAASPISLSGGSIGGGGGGGGGGTWTPNATYQDLWDGWNLTLEFDGTKNPLRSYAWGLDLSGSDQGAGGVGGLAFLSEHGGQATPTATHHACYDFNGNVTSLRNATGSSGGTVARYEYGPFGELLTARDALAGTNPFRFSTKYTDSETGLVYYGYRYYHAGLGRWLSRDPIEEGDGPGVYVFVMNNAAESVDALGLRFTTFSDCSQAQRQTLEHVGQAIDRRLPEVIASLPSYRSEWLQRKFPKLTPGYTFTLWDQFVSDLIHTHRLMRNTSHDGIRVACRCECPDGLSAEALYCIFYKNRIEFCPSYFTLTQGLQQSIAHHEMSHLAADTEDYSFKYTSITFGDPTMIGRTLNRAPRDAYYIELFMADVKTTATLIANVIPRPHKFR